MIYPTDNGTDLQSQDPMQSSGEPLDIPPMPQTQSDQYAQDYQQHYAPGGHTLFSQQIDPNNSDLLHYGEAGYQPQQLPPHETMQEKLAKEADSNGGFKTAGDASAAVVRVVRDFANEQGIDLRDPKNDSWYQAQLQHGGMYAKSNFLDDPKNLKDRYKQLDETHVLDMANHEVFNISNGQSVKLGQPPVPQAGAQSSDTPAEPINPDDLKKAQYQKAQGVLSSALKNEGKYGSKQIAAAQKFSDNYEKDQGKGVSLTPEALDNEARLSLLTGKTPAFGMGKDAAAQRAAFFNKRAEIAQNLGNSPEDQALKIASYKSNSSELTKLQNQRGIVMAFANTADKNLDLALSLSDKAGLGGSPLINKWIQAGKRDIGGDPDVASYDAAIRTAINEYAKVTSSATGGGTTSDQARKDAEGMLNAAQTPAQIKAVIATLKKDVGNRRSGYDEQIASTKDLISHVETKDKNVPRDENAPATPKMRRQVNKKTGAVRFVPE